MTPWEPTETELTAIRAEYAKGATDNQWHLFLSECRTRNLRPGVHLIFQLRKAKEYDPVTGAYVTINKPFWITTVAALRLIIERTGKYAGQTQPEYIYLDADGNPTIVSKIPLPKQGSTQIPREPWAVQVGIKRKDFDEPIIGMARFESVAGFTKTQDGVALTSMWAKRGPEMCQKCAEADGIRRAAPEEAGSYFIAEELKNEVEDTPQQPQAALAAAPTAPVVPTVNQTPAEGVEAPRPGEEKLPTLVEIVLNKTPGETTAPKTETSEATTKPKATRKKAKKSPVSGNPEPIKQPHDREDLGITDEDIANAGKPFAGETPEEAETRKAEAMAFAEDVGSATPVPDRLPSQEQKDGFIVRVRELVKTHSLNNGSLGKFFLDKTKKTKSADMTVGDWETVFAEIEKAVEAGTLKELVK